MLQSLLWWSMSMQFLFAQHKKVETWYNLKKRIPKESYYVLLKHPSTLDSTYISYYITGKIKVNGYYVKNRATGPWEYYYENGNMKMQGLLKDNFNEGMWKYFYENGNMNMEGEMNKGVREGEWKLYYENGKLKGQGIYKKDKKDGVWKYYYEDGQFKAQCLFDNDRGWYVEVYPSGQKKSEGEIYGGKSFGLWKYFYESGALKGEGQERDGIKEGMWKFYHPNGKLLSEGVYNKGSSEGNWKYYYENGTLSSEGIEKEGKKDGYWKLYYKNGSFKGEGNFISGDGSYKEYYENGKIKLEGFIRNGKNQDQWKYFYENGVMEGMCFFTDGRGKYTGYYENGKLSMEGMIIDGNKSGIWKLYKEDGSIAGYYRTYYENDVAVFKEINNEKSDSLRKDSVEIYAKPKLKIPKKRSRFFLPKVNEFRAIIVSTNPIAPLFFQIPISVEYYYQERMGYELGCILTRAPLVTSENNIPINDGYKRGFSIYLKQKFYQRDQEKGMLYFGHEARFSKMNHYVRTLDTSIVNQQIITTPHLNKYSLQYCILIGDRIMVDAKKHGWTIDLFAGVGLGYNYFDESWKSNHAYYNSLFTEINRNKIEPAFRFGINIGYAFKSNYLNK